MANPPTLTEAIVARCAALRLDKATTDALVFGPQITDAASLEKVMATAAEIHGLCNLDTIRRPHLVSKFVLSRLPLADIRVLLVDMLADESDKTSINVHAPADNQRDVWADRNAAA